jgi:glycerophosphoryl diester phosphodiesterase
VDRDFGLVSAHRGGVGRNRAEENSRSALERATGLGCEYVEFDVQVTADGKHVLLHDSRVKVSGRVVPVSSVRYETLVATLGDVVTLGEAAEILRGKTAAHVDLKFVSAPGDYARPESTLEVKAVEKVLEHLGPGGFVVTSQEDRSVRAVRDWSAVHAPELLVGLSLGRSLADAGPRILQVKLSEIFPQRRLESSRANLVVVSKGLARMRVAATARRLGLPLLVWTVDDERGLRRWLDHEGAWLVTTNDPSRALAVRARLKAERG